LLTCIAFGNEAATRTPTDCYKYLPKSTDLSSVTQTRLDEIAHFVEYSASTDAGPEVSHGSADGSLATACDKSAKYS
jgi:hypothetical protein